MKCKPLVSVIMPNYNGCLHLEESVQSVLNQTERDLELIVVDDASSDGSRSLLSAMRRRDPRIRLAVNPRNEGVAAARNKGFSMARGDYIALIDSDDIWMPEKLSLQLKRIEGADFCYTSYQRIDARGEPLGSVYTVPESADYEGLLTENTVGCSTVLMRARILKGMRMCGDFAHEDYAFWLKLLKAGTRMTGLKEPLVLYRVGGRSANKLRAARERWKIYRRSEGLSVARSARCFLLYCTKGCMKYSVMRKLGRRRTT